MIWNKNEYQSHVCKVLPTTSLSLPTPYWLHLPTTYMYWPRTNYILYKPHTDQIKLFNIIHVSHMFTHSATCVPLVCYHVLQISRLICLSLWIHRQLLHHTHPQSRAAQSSRAEKKAQKTQCHISGRLRGKRVQQYKEEAHLQHCQLSQECGWSTEGRWAFFRYLFKHEIMSACKSLM